MPSLQLIFYTLLSLVASSWGVLRVVESPNVASSYAFVLLCTAIAFFLSKLLLDSWQDIRESRRKALKGDPEAMYELAQALRQTDTMGAIRWSEKAAETGHREASFLAGFLRYGFGLHDQETFDYFMSAAKRGEEAAMRAVADCYKRGDCVLPNDRLSFEWRFKSAANCEAYSVSCNLSEYEKEDRKNLPGNVCSQHAVGMSFLLGEGCEKNEVNGYAWLLLAARAGHTDALKRIRELDRRKAYKLRALMQERALQIRNALEYGGVVEPDFVSPTGEGSSILDSGLEPAGAGDAPVESQPEPISAWRAFFTVLLAGNVLYVVLFVASRGERASVVPQEVFALLHFGFIAAALVAAFYGRKLKPLFHFLLLFAISVGASAAFAFWGRPVLVGYAIGASFAGGAIVLPPSIVMMHWRHAVADCLFYGLIALHGIGIIIALV